MPQALHRDLGPAGPPRQRGVFVVPQSAQVFFCWLSTSGDLLLISSTFDPFSLGSSISGSYSYI
uniref:Uncharacterized protein n=1 Tax=Rhizophora mucronata TaxID=61149 RepID=A0A2P2IKX7_RHIMU